MPANRILRHRNVRRLAAAVCLVATAWTMCEPRVQAAPERDTRAKTLLATLPATRPFDPDAYRARVVYDMARLRLEEVAGSNPWMLVRLTPDPCGYSEHFDWRIDEDGNAMDIRQLPGGAPTRPYGIYGGNVDVLARFGGRTDRCVTRYEELLFTVQNVPGTPESGPADALYDPFLPPGGLVLCRLNEGYAGRSRFAPALLLPEEWRRLVEPAVQWLRAHPDGLKSAHPEDRGPLLERAADPNPILAAAAFRTLLEENLVEPAEAARMVINALPQERQGVFTLLALRSGPAVIRADRL